MTIEEKIRHSVDRIVETAHPLKVILFGSHARGDAVEGSDLDFLVVERIVKDPVNEVARLRQAIGRIGVGVDLVVVDESRFNVWSDAPGSTLYWAKREGRVLYDAA